MASNFLTKEFAIINISEWQLDPQPAREPRKDGKLQGISDGLAKSLNVLHLYDFAIGSTAGAEYGLMGRIWGRNELVGELTAKGVGYTSGGNLCFQLANGKVENRHISKKPEKNLVRDRFLELCVNFSSILTVLNTGGMKFSRDTQRVSKRGRKGEGKPDELIYFPSEKQLEAVFRVLVYTNRALSKEEKKIPEVRETLAIIQCLIGDGEFDKYRYTKPVKVLNSRAAFAGFYGNEKLWKRVDDVSLASINRRTGTCSKTSKKYLSEEYGTAIYHNKPHTTLIWKKGMDVKSLLSLLPSFDESNAYQKTGDLPSGIHFAGTPEDDGLQWHYSKEGFVGAVNGGAEEVYISIYTMNTFNATNSEFNPIPAEEREITSLGNERDVMEARQITSLGLDPNVSVWENWRKENDAQKQLELFEPIVEESAEPEHEEPEQEAPVKCALLGKNYKRCDHDALGNGNPYCKQHTKALEAKPCVASKHDSEYTKGETNKFAPILDMLGLRKIAGLEEV